MSDIVEYRRDGHVAWIQMTRHDAMNALNSELARAIQGAVESATTDPDVRVLVLTGTGRAFCAGGDLKEILAELNSGRAASPDFLDTVGRALNCLRTCEKPVIAAVSGTALAGGLELILCCDVVFAAESARIGDAHANFGVFPGAGGAAVLPRRIGLHRAKALLFSGEDVSAQTLMDWGLVYQVVPDSELEVVVNAYAQKLARKSPLTLRGMKAVANASFDCSEVMSLRNELLALRDHLRTADFREGLNSFKEKREPHFEGR